MWTKMEEDANGSVGKSLLIITFFSPFRFIYGMQSHKTIMSLYTKGDFDHICNFLCIDM